eukprot:CAMPEP_0172519092 /NCGR_PEP_ID=MMETSP1066-20121228/291208_1 /TAXON_ID=671091 /ORGANISM="Coscinodiscus wailesii, Strain CCMP2513" /LENGTH=923 /DNA_ID=CAMNT_0013301609 /DNA_START=131 /DNA_END=2902 /DNA_ORIENTATION=+
MTTTLLATRKNVSLCLLLTFFVSLALGGVSERGIDGISAIAKDDRHLSLTSNTNKLIPIRYDTFNGDSNSSQTFWDDTYTPTPQSDHQWLSGSTGDLTNGIKSPHASITTDPTPYVAWTSAADITFYFSEDVMIESVAMSVDDSPADGICIPKYAIINQVVYHFPASTSQPMEATFFLDAPVVGSQVHVILAQKCDWMAVSEIEFHSSESPVLSKVTPVEYSTFNGGGVAGIALWDDSYSSNVTSPDADYTWLVGGLGKLTDGVKEAKESWFDNPTPYVGWQFSKGYKPDFTFVFDGNAVIDQVRFMVDDPVGDDSHDVCAPIKVIIHSEEYSFPKNTANGTEKASTGPYEAVIELEGEPVISEDVRVILLPACDWVMISEISFYSYDSDADGIPDDVDLCLGTISDGECGEEEGRYVWDGLNIVNGNGQTSGNYSMTELRGCSCHQIVERIGECQKGDCIERGCTTTIFNEWIEVCEAQDTVAPSMAISDSPSNVPSNRPTLMASQAPSFAPSYHPSATPTLMASHVPSFVPSPQPSVTPTLMPSHVPSFAPSPQPSATPSVYPSVMPTDSPTMITTSAPTFHPTTVPSPPTVGPTVVVSSLPSNTPSIGPMVAPTPVPTAQTSMAPSVFTPFPTPEPTGDLTTVPTNTVNTPSDFPSAFPSTFPSSFPSTDLTIPPTLSPTTKAPTNEPSSMPTYPPTPSPTIDLKPAPTKSATPAPTVNSPLPCLSWCYSPENSGYPWDTTCQYYFYCSGCPECSSTPPPRCDTEWCEITKVALQWTRKCANPRCGACKVCEEHHSFPVCHKSYCRTLDAIARDKCDDLRCVDCCDCESVPDKPVVCQKAWCMNLRLESSLEHACEKRECGACQECVDLYTPQLPTDDDGPFVAPRPPCQEGTCNALSLSWDDKCEMSICRGCDQCNGDE